MQRLFGRQPARLKFLRTPGAEAGTPAHSARSAAMRMATAVTTDAVRITPGAVPIDGDLTVPERAAGLVCFAHGSGSSRFSRRNRAVARVLENAGFGTLLLEAVPSEPLEPSERWKIELGVRGEAERG